ncbi:hypothetical protein U1872_06160 [Sphingomonas sp. RB3P16]|uniref:hypothetical protein n=1 Tax=Parasphingomonas frigoris TaxID=3096163 RepID=UPI002FC6F704
MTDAAKTAFGAQPWKKVGLYVFLLDLFPQHRSSSGLLDVRKLATELGKSHEAVYKWLRKSKISPANADAIRELAIKLYPDTVLDRKDFDPFVYA